MSEIAIVCLGANGDIINALPIAREESLKGNHVTMVVSKEYESILDGVSYASRIALDLHYSKPMVAYDFAKSTSKFHKIYIAQTYGTNIKTQTDSFQKEVYRICNRLDSFGKTIPVFDQRSHERERALVSKFPTVKPWILYNSSGRSSPFSHHKDLEQLVCSFSDSYDIINIGTTRAERFFDLLGLFDKGSVLVTIDSGPLHLSSCSNIPVISLITDKPTPWYGAVPPRNSICSVRYGEYPSRREDIKSALKSVRPLSVEPVYQKKIFHVYSEFHASGETGRRNDFASQTWKEEYKRGNWIAVPLHESDLFRSSRNIGDRKPVPFIKDIVNKAADISSDDDLIVLTNRDTCFSIGLTDALISELNHAPAIAAHRYDFHHRLNEIYSPNQTALGNWYCGVDLFAFTRRWWLRHRDEFPDMLLSYESWDLVLRQLICMRKGVEWHFPIIFHEVHSAFWSSPGVKDKHPSQLHNIRLCQRFLKSHGLPLNEIGRLSLT